MMNQEYCVSVEAEINSELHKSLLRYLDSHPYWDLNRMLDASLSMFMMQNWSEEEGLKPKDYSICSRVYLDSIFDEHRSYVRYEQNR